MSNIENSLLDSLKNQRDGLREGYNGLLDNLTPSEFMGNIQMEMQNFISDPKWRRIIGTTPFETLSAQYDNLTTHVRFFNEANSHSDESAMEKEFNTIKEVARQILLNLSSSIDILEKGKRFVRAEKIEEKSKLDGENTGKAGVGDQSIYVTAETQDTRISSQRPSSGIANKTKSLNIRRLNTLLLSLGKLVTQIDNWDSLTRTAKIEFLGQSSGAYVTLVENYQSSWSDLMLDLTSDYSVIWNKIKKDSDDLNKNFHKLIQCIKDLKDPPYSLITIKMEVQNAVTTIIEIVSYEMGQNGDFT